MRKLVILFFASVALLATGAAHAQTVLPRAGWVATGSSTNPGDVASNAIDGSSVSRWSSGTPQTSGQWFSLDMITPQTISQVTLDPGASSGDFTKAYQVFVSNDAVTWGDPVASGTGGAGVLTVVFPTQTARFVGIVQTGTGTNWWSISEINVYGPGAFPTVALSPAGWLATASLTGGSEVASRAIDGTVSTRWTSGAPQASGQTFQLDMLSAKTMTMLTMDSSTSTSDYARGYQVFATNDLTSWGAPLASGAGTSGLVAVSFAQKTARYLKIVLTGSASSWWSIAELTVYGPGPFAPVAMVLPRTGWTATGSPSCSSATPAQALDDNASTRFSTCQNQTNGQSFQVDMLVPRSLTKVTLDAGTFSGDYARGYQLFVSNDGATWGTAVATGAATTQLITVTFPSQTARFLKVVQTGTASSNWWSIAELNVYGLAPSQLLRNGWTASASLNTSTAVAGIDGNASTRWTTGAPQANGQWFQVDMRAPQAFNQLVLDSTGSSSDYPRTYQVFASNSPTTFGAAIASGAASASVVSIGFADQSARYLRVVQTGSNASWWSIAELNVYASPTLVQIQTFLDQAYYATSDIASSFVYQGQPVDCINFYAQHSVKAWMAAGVTMPTTLPTLPAGLTAMPPPNGAANLGFNGQLDANGHAQQCGSGLVPVTRPTVAAVQAAGGVAAFQLALASRKSRLMGRQDSTQHDCWLNSAPGDGVSPPPNAHSVDWEHSAGVQTTGWLPTGAPGFYGANIFTPVYSPFLQSNPAPASFNLGAGHTDSQFWIQSGTCETWYNETTNVCRTTSACTNCAGNPGGCPSDCAVQSLEMTALMNDGDASPHLAVFFTSDGYFKNWCYAGDSRCASCPAVTVTPPGQPPSKQTTDCFVALPGAKLTSTAPLATNFPTGATSGPSQYGVVPNEVQFSAWNGSASGKPGWWISVNNNLIGWYPPGTFNWTDGTPGQLSNGPATYLQAGGEVYNTWPGGFHTDTAMVSDNAAQSGYEYAAYQHNISYLDAQQTVHDTTLGYVNTPPAEGDLGIPGLCGLTAGGWTDATGAKGAYTIATTTVPPGGPSWGQYMYFGGGRLANEVAPPVPTKEPVAIIFHQYAACSFVPTNLGGASTGPHASYVVYKLDNFDNSSNSNNGSVPFAFDPARLYVTDPITGLRDSVDPTLMFYPYILGPLAAVPTTVPANTFEPADSYVALVVNTTAEDGPTEASTTPYTLKYDAQPTDQPVVMFQGNPTFPLPGPDNCTGIGLGSPP
jgi:F5/8 type C domain/Neprosin